jgi:hypothetical protein
VLILIWKHHPKNAVEANAVAVVEVFKKTNKLLKASPKARNMNHKKTKLGVLSAPKSE